MNDDGEPSSHMTVRPFIAFATLGLIARSIGAWGQCDPSTPTFDVDLSSSPSATFITPDVQREGLCCSAVSPEECILFIVTLHPDAQGILFEICDGAIPSGAMYYQVGCGATTAVGQPMCLTGPGPHHITFCKPGNNMNKYCISSLEAPEAGPNVHVGFGCSSTITSTGFSPGSTLWTSVWPGGPGEYDPLLTCPTCLTTDVLSQPWAPPVVQYQICGFAVSPCSSMVFCDTVSVYFHDPLAVDIDPDEPSVCFGSSTTHAAAVVSGGYAPYTYTWSNGMSSDTIEVGVGTYSVTVSDPTGCNPATTSVTITGFTSPIAASAGADQVICGGIDQAQLQGSVAAVPGGIWSGGAGNFSPSDTVLDATYTPTAAELAAGTLNLTLTTTGNGSCQAVSDDVSLTFSPGFDMVGITGSPPLCHGDANAWASVGPVQPGWNITWNDPAQQTTAMASGLVAGTYKVHIMDAAGCDTALVITLEDPPLLQLSVVTLPETCAGELNGTAATVAVGGTGPYSYAWSTGASTPSIDAGAGTYTVHVNDANGCGPVSASAVITALALPNQANAGPDQIVCASNGPVLLSGSVVNAAGGQWSGGTGTFNGSGTSVSYEPSNAEVLAGMATLFLTTTGNTNCPAATDQVAVTIDNQLLDAAVTATHLACNSENTGTASFTPNDNAFTYQWNDPFGQTTASINGLYAGTYTVHVSTPAGCDTSLAVTVTEPPALHVADVLATDPLCAGEQTGGIALVVTGGTAPTNTVWSGNANGQTGASLSGLSAGTYAYSITDANGCLVQGTVDLDQPLPLQLQINLPDTVCSNVPTVLTATASGGTGALDIAWTGLGSGSTLVHSFTASTVVGVTVTDANGCAGPALQQPVFVVDLSSTTFTVSSDTAICPGGTALLHAELTGAPPNTELVWPELGVTGEGPFAVSPATSSTYHVALQNVCSQPWMLETDVLVETPPAIVLPEIIAEGCGPLTVQFPSDLTGQAVSYFWSLGDGTTSTLEAPVHTYQIGNYTVTLSVTTPLGCTGDAANSSSVIVRPSPNASFTASDHGLEITSPTVHFTNGSTGNWTGLQWFFGDGEWSAEDSPSHTYGDTGVFVVQLVLENMFGCTDTANAVIAVSPTHYIDVPNTFTPDPNTSGGGYFVPDALNNDVFYAFTEYAEAFEMTIWNRWGELVFETHDPRQGWDGWYRGRLSPQDVYAYRIHVTFSDGHEDDLIGNVTLLR